MRKLSNSRIKHLRNYYSTSAVTLNNSSKWHSCWISKTCAEARYAWTPLKPVYQLLYKVVRRSKHIITKPSYLYSFRAGLKASRKEEQLNNQNILQSLNYLSTSTAIDGRMGMWLIMRKTRRRKRTWKCDEGGRGLEGKRRGLGGEQFHKRRRRLYSSLLWYIVVKEQLTS